MWPMGGLDADQIAGDLDDNAAICVVTAGIMQGTEVFYHEMTAIHEVDDAVLFELRQLTADRLKCQPKKVGYFFPRQRQSVLLDVVSRD